MGERLNKILAVIREKKLEKTSGFTPEEFQLLDKGEIPRGTFFLRLTTFVVENKDQFPADLQESIKEMAILKALLDSEPEMVAELLNSGTIDLIFEAKKFPEQDEAIGAALASFHGLHQGMAQGTLDPLQALPFMGAGFDELAKTPLGARIARNLKTAAGIVEQGPRDPLEPDGSGPGLGGKAH